MKIHGHVTASPDREPTPVIGTQNLESRIGLPGRSEELDLLKRPSIPRSISYSQGSVSNLTGTSLEGSKLTLNVSDSSLTSLRQDTPRRLSVKRNVDNKSQGLRRHHSSLSLSNPKIAISKFMISEKSNGDGTELNVGKVVSPLEQERKTRLLSSSLSNLARPWGITSRSPSPTKRQAPQEVLNDLESSAAKLPSQTPPPNNAQGQTHSNSNGSIFTRSTKDPLTGKLPRRPLSAFLGRAESKGSMPSVATIPKSVSTDRLPSLFHTTSSTKPSSTLKSPSSDRLQGTAIDVPRRKDEIWPAFRNLDAEYQK